MLDEAWKLSPAVALRPEPFGAMAYHFGNRKLTFLKRPQLVAVVKSLADYPNVRSALIAAEVSENEYEAYRNALHGMAQAEMIVPRTEGSAA